MKIAIIGPAYPYRGGLATYNERLAREFLKDRNNTVTMYTFTLQYPNFLFPGKSQFSDEEAPEGLKIIPCINSINPLNWIVVGRRINKQNYDLVISRYWLPFMGPCFGTILRIIKNSKRISIIDNIIPHEKRIGDKMFTTYFVKAIDGFVAMSQNVLDDISIFDKEKPRILSPHPLYDNYGEIENREQALKKIGLSEEYRYIMFFGFIRDYKGLDILIDAFYDVTKKVKNIKLIIAGEYYTNKNIYISLIKKNKLTDNIILRNDFIPNSQVANYFNAADLIVQPYKNATQSGVTQVAYHFNKPVIVTDVGGLKEMCPNEKVGFVVPPNARSITDAIIRFYDEDWSDRMQMGIKEEKKKYRWSLLVKNILKLLIKQ